MKPTVTATTSDYSVSPGTSPPERVGSRDEHRLDAVVARGAVEVVAVDGDDAIRERLAASGLWAGAVLEHITSAPFGDPMLFRVHGYRLALRRSEAQCVRVVSSAAVGSFGAN
jgi:Fe2+ transport system protein FeoA